ncbi:MAG: peptide deformylase [Pararhodobacter sp.]
MALLPILQYPDPVLRQPCAPVGAVDDTIRQLATDMLETMYAAPGRGLAAPQVGVLLRLFVMDCTWREGTPDPRICINPRIADASPALAINTESCLSIPGVPALVARPDWILLHWTDLDGQDQAEVLQGFDAIAAQHELDHLDGRLCIDHMDAQARAAAEPLLARFSA